MSYHDQDAYLRAKSQFVSAKILQQADKWYTRLSEKNAVHDHKVREYRRRQEEAGAMRMLSAFDKWRLRYAADDLDDLRDEYCKRCYLMRTERWESYRKKQKLRYSTQRAYIKEYLAVKSDFINSLE